ncbi:MAG: ribbon-helix-helix domain-containing protein [Acidimicrobiales bacterium]
MSSKNRITVNLSDDEFEALSELAKRTRVSKAWLGRQAITTLLEQAQKNADQMPLQLVGLHRRGNQ